MVARSAVWPRSPSRTLNGSSAASKIGEEALNSFVVTGSTEWWRGATTRASRRFWFITRPMSSAPIAPQRAISGRCRAANSMFSPSKTSFCTLTFSSAASTFSFVLFPLEMPCDSFPHGANLPAR